ncbi:hypothetical protein LZ30DRAFT_718132 [Colletotrichum cereale]|nr:hypothetical protein LZ30DRAFT_718132 [Colletotrichum cereale]
MPFVLYELRTDFSPLLSCAAMSRMTLGGSCLTCKRRGFVGFFCLARRPASLVHFLFVPILIPLASGATIPWAAAFAQAANGAGPAGGGKQMRWSRFSFGKRRSALQPEEGEHIEQQERWQLGINLIWCDGGRGRDKGAGSSFCCLRAFL